MKRPLPLFLLLLTMTFGCSSSASDGTSSQTSSPRPPFIFENIFSGARYHVSPTGTETGDGSATSPWSLQYAFDGAGGVIQPGDIVWLENGTYTGKFTARVSGDTSHPVLFRAAENDKVIIESDPAAAGSSVIVMKGSYLWVWGLIVQDPLANQRPSAPGQPDIPIADLTNGVNILAGHESKLINCVVHNTTISGLNAWKPATETEVYGNLVHHSGWYSSTEDRGRGHSFYTQNQNGHKYIRDNILIHSFKGQTIQIYTEGGYIDNFVIENNVLSQGRALIGGLKVAHNPEFRGNYVPADGRFQLGYQAGSDHAVIENNYILQAINIIDGPHTNLSITNNYVGGQPTGGYEDQMRDNTFAGWAGTLVHTEVRPNYFDPDRAHVIVINQPEHATVAVNVQGFLSLGDRFELRDAYNYFAAPVQSGTYAGGPLTITMTGLSAALPWGNPPDKYKRIHPAPGFGTFILTKAHSG